MPRTALAIGSAEYGTTIDRTKQMTKRNDAPEVQKRTISVPRAGEEYYGLSRGASYEAAKRGDIPTIKIGKLKRVSVRVMEAKMDAGE